MKKKLRLKGAEDFKLSNHFPPSLYKMLGKEVSVVEGIVSKKEETIIDCGGKLLPVPRSFFVDPSLIPTG